MGSTHAPVGRPHVPFKKGRRGASSNPEFDAILTKAEGLLDFDRRREVVAELQKIMREDGPTVQPIWRMFFTVHDKRLQGFMPHPTRYAFFNELAFGT